MEMENNGCTLTELIQQWEFSPQKYTNLLVDQIHPTLKKMCLKQFSNYNKDVTELPTSASSVVNEVYLKLSSGSGDTDVSSVRKFHTHLRQIIRCILLDKARQSKSDKRALERNSNFLAREEYALFTSNNNKNIDIAQFDEALQRLKDIDKAAYEVISFKFYSANTNVEIAEIMSTSKKTVERYVKGGMKTLNALYKDTGTFELGVI